LHIAPLVLRRPFGALALLDRRRLQAPHGFKHHMDLSTTWIFDEFKSSELTMKRFTMNLNGHPVYQARRFAKTKKGRAGSARPGSS
jgi:hypothetical protein